MDNTHTPKDTVTNGTGTSVAAGKLADAAYRKAFECHRRYGCCTQCVLDAVQETVGVVEDAVVKASDGLSCGGGLLALGARYGRNRDESNPGCEMNRFQIGRALAERFRAEFGGLTCEDLQRRFAGRTYDLWDPVQYKAFSDARGSGCARAAGLVAQWVVEVLAGAGTAPIPRRGDGR